MSTVKSPPDVPFVLRIPLELRAEVDGLARREQRSLAFIFRRLVRLGLQAERARIAANVDADAGTVG